MELGVEDLTSGDDTDETSGSLFDRMGPKLCGGGRGGGSSRSNSMTFSSNSAGESNWWVYREEGTL